MTKRAVVTGITGHDGSYLAGLLLDKGYEVHGLIRRSSTFNTSRIDHLYVDPHDAHAALFLHYADLGDGSRLSTLLKQIDPAEVFHLAPRATSACRSTSRSTPATPPASARRACSRQSEPPRSTRGSTRRRRPMFGASPAPQNEDTFHPRSPYGAAKLYGYWMTRNYREGYGLYAVNGILFNHESPRRGETFVTRKIAIAAAAIANGRQVRLFLGNLAARRDWGYAPSTSMR